ncbi:hypothetical protein [Amycolatopsis cihanbeyliensis]|uniref:PE family protein n=1 Tax=Amycolatopsis cihanbeyliensis TaxID=1128664 RepID=A0A542DKH2_AMYCI|nr:hypothetical protein [Amycolatopsis cihanbeyliensis]TQJ03592.1 PE family protein [Amycolatopsis cihanbeyliensis]
MSDNPSGKDQQPDGSGGGALAAYSLGAGVPTAPDARDIRVDPSRLLEVAAVIETQANQLQDKVRAQLEALRIEPPSQDVVSIHAVEAWNNVIVDGEESYERRVRSYVQGLRSLVEQLRAASAEYEGSEDERAESFGDRVPGA